MNKAEAERWLTHPGTVKITMTNGHEGVGEVIEVKSNRLIFFYAPGSQEVPFVRIASIRDWPTDTMGQMHAIEEP